MARRDPQFELLKSWPANELESVNHCPICESEERSRLYHDVRDRVFGAPGSWRLQQCSNCEVAYLDPRPTAGSIGRAYDSYYTHEPDADVDIQEPPARSVTPKVLLRKAKVSLQQNYINRRYGYHTKATLPLGRQVMQRLPLQRREADRMVRFLHAVPDGRLLDVGCGSGGFLSEMRSRGWEVSGIDADEAAIRACQRQGIDAIHGTLESASFSNAAFDAVTMCHVIEHLHQPARAVESCRRILRPGGVLYLETPNLASTGHSTFGSEWRGLETPRHITILNVRALKALCAAADLEVEGVFGIPQLTSLLLQQSMAIRDGRDPYGRSGTVPLSTTEANGLKERQLEGFDNPEACDVIALVARCPT